MPPQVQDDIDDFLSRYTKKRVAQEAQRQGIDPSAVDRIARAESGYRPDVITGRRPSRTGAIGPMQLMPATAKDLGVDPYDLDANVEGGVRYFKQQLKTFGGDQTKAAAAYNAGPGAVQKYKGVPPYRETQDYVKKVAGGQGDDIDEFLSRYEGQPKEPAQAPMPGPQYRATTEQGDLIKPANRPVRTKPLSEKSKRFQQAGELIRQIQGGKERAAELFRQADRTPGFAVEGGPNPGEVLRARAEGELEKANRLGEMARQSYGDLIEVGYGDDANRQSNRKWVYAKSKRPEVFEAFMRPYQSGEAMAAQATREDIDRSIRQQRRIQEERARFQSRSRLGQLAERALTGVLSGDPGASPDAREDLAIRRAALGISDTDEQPSGLSQAGRKFGEAALKGITSGARGLAEIIDTSPARLPKEIQPQGLAEQIKPYTDLASRAATALTQPNPTDESWFTSKIPGALGSTVPFLLGGGAARLAGIAPSAASAGLGAAMNVGQVAEEIDQMGIDPSRRDRAIAVAAATGLTEAAGLGGMLDRFGLKRTFLKRALDVVEEGGQEGLQEFLNNFNAKVAGAYDKDRSLSKGVLESALLGGVVGGGFQGVDIAGNRLAGRLNQTPATQPQAGPLTTEPAQPTSAPVSPPASTTAPSQTATVQAAQPTQPAPEPGSLGQLLEDLRARTPQGQREAAARQKKLEAEEKKTAEEQGRLDLYNESQVMAAEAAERARGFIDAGDLPGAANELLAQQDALREQVRQIPRTPEGLRERDAINRQIRGLGNQVKEIGRQAKEAAMRNKRPGARSAPQQALAVTTAPAGERSGIDDLRADYQRQAAGRQIEQQIRQEAGLPPQSARTQQAQAQRQGLLEASTQIAEEAGTRAEEMVAGGRIADALGELRAQQRALNEATRYVPRSPEGLQLKSDLQRQSGRVGNRIGDLRRGGGQAQPRSAPLLESRVNPEGGIPEQAPAYEPGARFERLAAEARAPREAEERLLTAIRRAGGIRDDGDTTGELRRLGIAEAGTTGLVNNRRGVSPDQMREMMVSEGLSRAETVGEFFDEIEAEMRAAQARKGREEEDLGDYYERQAAQNQAESRPTPRTVASYLEEVAGELEPGEAASLRRTIERSERESPRAYEERTRPGEPGSGGVSFSPYAVLIQNNRQQTDRLYDLDLRSEEAQGIIDGLRDYAVNNGIELKHVHALLDYVRNYQIEQASWEDRGLTLEETQIAERGETLDYLNDQEQRVNRVLEPAISRLDDRTVEWIRRSGREIDELLQTLNEDPDMMPLFESAIAGNDQAYADFEQGAVEAYGFSPEAARYLVEQERESRRLRSTNRGRAAAARIQEKIARADRERPVTEGGRKSAGRPAAGTGLTTKDFDLINRNPAEIPDKEFDDHLRAIEDLRNQGIKTSLFGGIDLAEGEERQIGAVIRMLNDVRVERRKEGRVGRKNEPQRIPSLEERQERYKLQEETRDLPEEERQQRLAELRQRQAEESGGASAQRLSKQDLASEIKKGGERTVTHPDPALDGKPIIAETADGRVVVPNPDNKSGVSVVKDRREEAAGPEVSKPSRYRLDSISTSPEAASASLGRSLSLNDIGDLAGAPDGAELRVQSGVNPDGRPTIFVGAFDKSIGNQKREIYLDLDGKLVLHNVQLQKVPDAPSGYMRKVLDKQIKAARRLGVDRIEARATGGPGLVRNGYYTLPGLGYDGPLKPEWLKDAPKSLQRANTIQELFAREGGRAWWKQHGRSMEVSLAVQPASRRGQPEVTSRSEPSAVAQSPGRFYEEAGRIPVAETQTPGGIPLSAATGEEPKIVQEARQRLRESSKGERAGSGGQQLADLAIVTGYKLYRAGMQFGQWSRAMLKELGQAVRPYLQQTWKMLQSPGTAGGSSGTYLGGGLGALQPLFERKSKAPQPKVALPADWDIGKWSEKVVDELGKLLKEGKINKRQEANYVSAINDLLSATNEGDGAKLFLAREKLAKLSAGKFSAGDILGAPRSILAGGDISFVLRQGGAYNLPGLFISPKQTVARILKAAAAVKEGNYARANAQIAASARAEQMRESGLHLANQKKITGDNKLTDREEGYLSRFLQDVPVYKQSERANTTMLDMLRSDVFDKYATYLEKRGVTFETNPRAYKQMAKFINLMTGRGSLGEYDNAIPFLSNFLFSPRWLVSRVQLLGLMPKLVKDAAADRLRSGRNAEDRIDPNVRMLMWRDLGAYAGSLGLTLGLLAAAGAAGLANIEVGDDPEDSDFGKVIVNGKHHYELSSGLAPYIVFGTRMSKAAIRRAKGETLKPNEQPIEILKNFARSKASPAAGFAVSALSGKDFRGRPITAGEAALETINPLIISGFLDGYNVEGGSISGGLASIPSFIGAGYSAYEREGQAAGAPDLAKEGRKRGVFFGETFLRGESAEAAKSRAEKRKQYVSDYGPLLLQSREYQTADEALKRKILEAFKERTSDLANEKKPNFSELRPGAILKGIRIGEKATETRRKNEQKRMIYAPAQ